MRWYLLSSLAACRILCIFQGVAKSQGPGVRCRQQTGLGCREQCSTSTRTASILGWSPTRSRPNAGTRNLGAAGLCYRRGWEPSNRKRLATRISLKCPLGLRGGRVHSSSNVSRTSSLVSLPFPHLPRSSFFPLAPPLAFPLVRPPPDSRPGHRPLGHRACASPAAGVGVGSTDPAPSRLHA